MKVTVVYNDTSRIPGLETGTGFSCLVGGGLLFDTGSCGGALIGNMRALGIDSSSMARVVISHDHWDHTGGLTALLRETASPLVLGCPGFGDWMAAAVEEAGGRYREPEGPEEIVPGVSVSGCMTARYGDGSLVERALVLDTGKGVSVITGCAHPGIATVVESVRAALPGRPLHAVMGGFHLRSSSEGELRDVMDRLEAAGVRLVAPMHCTGPRATEALIERFGDGVVILGAGECLEL